MGSKYLIFCVLLCACAPVFFADTLFLSSGKTIVGRYLGGDGQAVRFEDSDHKTQTVPLDQVDLYRSSALFSGVLCPGVQRGFSRRRLRHFVSALQQFKIGKSFAHFR